MIHMSQSNNFYNERILNFVLPLCQIQLQQKRLEVNHVNRSL